MPKPYVVWLLVGLALLGAAIGYHWHLWVSAVLGGLFPALGAIYRTRLWLEQRLTPKPSTLRNSPAEARDLVRGGSKGPVMSFGARLAPESGSGSGSEGNADYNWTCPGSVDSERLGFGRTS